MPDSHGFDVGLAFLETTIAMSISIRLRATTLAIAALSLVQLGCGAAGDSPGVTNPPAGTSGKLVVLVQPQGNGRDADGFSATLDGASARTVADDPTSVTYDNLSPGDHTLRIAGVAPHCSATADSITHTVKAGATDTVAVGLACLGGFAYVELVDTTRYDIKYLTEDGRTIQLTNGPDLKFIDGWSPDGTRLLYTQYENGHFHLHTVRADGTDPKVITSGTGNEYAPRWSPDGARIAFEQTGTGLFLVVADADADGANAHPFIAPGSSTEIDPTWSSDGSRLYFGCDHFGRMFDLCTAALDGSGLQAINYTALDSVMAPCTPICAVSAQHFQTAPGGGRISFETLSDVASQRVWTANLDGTGAVPLSGSTSSFGGSWSPTGDRMLLEITDGADRYALATVKADGSGYLQITGFDAYLQQGAWSPDGKSIAYVDLRAGQIGVMHTDGTGRQLITHGMAFSFAPFWNPKARGIGTLSPVRAPSVQVEQLSKLPRLRPEVLLRHFHARA